MRHSDLTIGYYDRADEGAKKATQMRHVTGLPLSQEDHTKLTKNHYLELWKNSWKDNMCNHQQKGYVPAKFPSYFELKRRDQICLTRLVFRTCKFTHEHYYKKETMKECTTCKYPMNMVHLIMMCPLIEKHRKEMKDYCQKNDIQFYLENISCNLASSW